MHSMKLHVLMSIITLPILQVRFVMIVFMIIMVIMMKYVRYTNIFSGCFFWTNEKQKYHKGTPLIYFHNLLPTVFISKDENFIKQKYGTNFLHSLKRGIGI